MTLMKSSTLVALVALSVSAAGSSHLRGLHLNTNVTSGCQGESDLCTGAADCCSGLACNCADAACGFKVCQPTCASQPAYVCTDTHPCCAGTGLACKCADSSCSYKHCAASSSSSSSSSSSAPSSFDPAAGNRASLGKDRACLVGAACLSGANCGGSASCACVTVPSGVNGTTYNECQGS